MLKYTNTTDINPVLLIYYDFLRRPYLDRHYEIVNLDEVVESKSEKMVAVTFDDGYRGVYDHAFPILKDMKLLATVFLITDYLGSSKVLWWEYLSFQIKKFLSLAYIERINQLNRLSNKWKSILRNNPTIHTILEYFKTANSF